MQTAEGAMPPARGTIEDIAARLGRDHGRQIDRFMAQPAWHGNANAAQEPAAESSVLARIIFWTCAGLTLLTGAMLFTVHLFGAEIARAGFSADATKRQIVIGNDVLDVPGNVIRFRAQRRAQNLERLDLYFFWPEMTGYSDRLSAEFDRPSINPAILFVTIEPRSMTQDMTGRIEPIYSKFMEGPETDAGHGLKRRALSAAGGFAGEELWYEAESPYPFAARCVRSDDPTATPYCLRDFHAGQDLSVTYRFHRSLIGEWMTLDRAVRAEINAMVAD
jgi:hypothetical protein